MIQNEDVPNSVEIIDGHLDNFFESEEILVLHEKESEVVHGDIYIVKPNDDRNYNILLSCGLSALPMQVPEGFDHLKFAEISILLPPNWNLNYDDFANENNYWPIRALKQLTKYPHLNDTWLGCGHTIPLDDRYPVNHRFTAIILLESITLPESFTYIETDEKDIYFYAAIPLYQEELEFTELGHR
ncbi:suppressor of fused domain protein [Olivibacter sp. LS-1]|uniref:suppressor of fused domain protein n=1 Tax=Olivibacter sp. LS-1 TaxID=2592345 RepID=UPI0011EB8D13|nr:suppressor of fused domain protein [Olivibacter sp. LS-1]QEK99472.1 suppressor of fused domain protein [Olivibacter sp. LS-1]